MGLREKINRNPMIPTLVAVIAVAIGAYVVYATITDKGLTVDQPTQYYYTVDDGKTLFAGPLDVVPPFEKDGKMAVRAHVFTCDKGKTQFVAYLSKYTDEFAKRASSMMASQTPDQPSILDSAAASQSLLVRKPDSGDWYPAYTDAGQRILSIRCPSNDPWDLVELHPK